MGCHLSAPEKTKKTTIGLTSRLHYVAMGMQGNKIYFIILNKLIFRLED
jgi:hypothetical protein